VDGFVPSASPQTPGSNISANEALLTVSMQQRRRCVWAGRVASEWCCSGVAAVLQHGSEHQS